MPLILCCRLKLNNRAIKIIVHIRTLFARHHPDWKNIALCSLNIKPKGNQFETIILLTTFPPWLSLFRQKVLNLIESTLQLSFVVLNWYYHAKKKVLSDVRALPKLKPLSPCKSVPIYGASFYKLR